MDQQQRLLEYVKKQRERGASDAAIREKLLAARIPEEVTTRAMAQPHLLAATLPERPYFTVHRWTNPFHAYIHTNRRQTIAIFICTLIVISGVSMWASRHHTHTTPSVSPEVTIHDPNFSVNLPVGWQSNADYQPGAGLSVFHAPHGSGRLVVYVVPFTDASTSSTVHVANQLLELSKNGAQSHVVTTQQVLFGSTRGNITAATVSAPRSTSQMMCYLYGNVDYSSVAYNIDMATDGGGCSGKRLNAYLQSLESFRPKTADLLYKSH